MIAAFSGHTRLVYDLRFKGSGHIHLESVKSLLRLITRTPLSFFDGGRSYLVCILQRRCQFTDMTLESKVKLPYTYILPAA